MSRPRFLEKERPQIFLHPPKHKLDKKGNKVITLPFTIEMRESYAAASDPVIEGAFKECAEPKQERDAVTLRTRVENTDIAIFELAEHPSPLFRLVNVELVALKLTRSDGNVYLTFQAELPLLSIPGLGKFALERYATSMWAEFKAAQFAFQKPSGVANALAEMVGPVAKNDGITSMTLSVEGGPSVTIDKEDAKRIQQRAKKKGAGE